MKKICDAASPDAWSRRSVTAVYERSGSCASMSSRMSRGSPVAASGHREAVVDRSAGLRPVRRHARRHDPHFVEGKRRPRGRRQREMTQMNQVEGAPSRPMRRARDIRSGQDSRKWEREQGAGLRASGSGSGSGFGVLGSGAAMTRGGDVRPRRFDQRIETVPAADEIRKNGTSARAPVLRALRPARQRP
jgi:hypothetical protein